MGGDWNKLLDYDNIGELKFLNYCLSESLRMQPPIHKTTNMILTENLNIEGYHFKKGCKIGVIVTELHHNP